MTTAAEDLQQMVADIDIRINTVHNPSTSESDHRRTVDLYRALAKATALQKQLDDNLSMNLTGSITSYITKAASE